MEPGLSVGQWLFEHLNEHYVIEREPWATDRAARVLARLDAVRPAGRRLSVVIPWLRAVTAFTAPGPYIFFSRSLYQLCPDDETSAFVIAHEMAHHDLGHLRTFPPWLGRLARARGVDLPFLVFRAVERRLYGPEMECQADEHALSLCLRAGYDGRRCLRFFGILENYLLNMKDEAAVVGPDPDSDEELSPDAPFMTKARIWAWQRAYGYLPVRDRRQRLEHYLYRVSTADGVRPN